MLDRARKVAKERGEDPDEVCFAPWRVHDFRRTIASGMERLGVRLQVVEALLGHKGGSKAGIVGVYQQHNYAEEKRKAVEKWAKHVGSLLRGAK
jgi:integrase